MTTDLAKVKETIDAKIGEMDTKLGGVGGEVSKLPLLEGRLEDMGKRLTEYTENLAIQQAKVTEVMMTEVMKITAQMADKDAKIAEL